MKWNLCGSRKAMTDFNPKVTLRCSIQQALVGEVTPRLVAVTCGIQGEWIYLKMYVESKCQEDDLERLYNVGGLVIGDFPENYRIDESCVSIEDEAPRMLDFWTFMREGMQT